MFPLVSICQKLNLCQKTYFQNLWDSYLIYFPKVIPSYCNPRKYLEISKPFFFFWMIATNQTFHCYQTLGDRFYSQKNGKPIVCIWYDPLLILLEPHFCWKKSVVVVVRGKMRHIDPSPTLFLGKLLCPEFVIVFNFLHLLVYR